MARNEINVVMLGPSHVGKSSLLTTMYREIGNMKMGFVLTPDDETSDRLSAAYQRLRSVMDDPSWTPVPEKLGPTTSFIENRFEVSFQGSKEFDLIFHDIRGTAMMQAGADLDSLRTLIAQSHIIVNVIDAVVLMETDKMEAEEWNGHMKIREVLARTLQPREKYLILFVLVKCESYIKTPNQRGELIRKFEERHKVVLNLIDEMNQTRKNVAALLIPVQTLGCVEFVKIQEGNFIFVNTGKDFKPHDVDQPLRYVLSFALNRRRTILIQMVDWLTGRRREFQQALKNFYASRDQTFKKYGNSELLEVK